MADAYLLENGIDRLLLEDGSGLYLLDSVPAVALSNSAEGGTDTTAVTTANSGGTSGNAWDTVTGAPTFSATHAAHGTLCYSFPAATATNVQWSAASIGMMATLYARLYVYPTANPAATFLAGAAGV